MLKSPAWKQPIPAQPKEVSQATETKDAEGLNTSATAMQLASVPLDPATEAVAGSYVPPTIAHVKSQSFPVVGSRNQHAPSTSSPGVKPTEPTEHGQLLVPMENFDRKVPLSEPSFTTSLCWSGPKRVQYRSVLRVTPSVTGSMVPRDDNVDDLGTLAYGLDERAVLHEHERAGRSGRVPVLV